MTPFFRRIRRKLANDNKFLMYSRYAIGEIVLVVIGILIAVQINNWNEERKGKKIEKELLLTIKKNCQTNIAHLLKDFEVHQFGIRSSDIVLDAVRNRLPYFDSLAYHFHYAVILPDHNLSYTAYENLKSTGFDIIRDNDLKSEIIDLYDVTYSKMTGSLNIVQRNRLDLSIPYYAQHFERNVSAIPNNYDELLGNQEYINLIVWIRSLHTWAIYLKEPCIKESQRVIDMIDLELKKY